MSSQEVPWQFAILCVITQSFRRVLVSVACSDMLLQSKRLESPAASGTGATGVLILHWQSGISPLPLPIPSPMPLPLCEPVMNSVPETEVVKTPTPHKANIEGIFGGCWLPLLCGTLDAWLTSGMEPIIVFRIWIEICLGAFVKRCSN